MIRLVVKSGQKRAMVEVHGMIIAGSFDPVGAQCSTLLGRGLVVSLDLTHVTYVDRVGAAALRRLLAAGVTIEVASPLLNEFLAATRT